MNYLQEQKKIAKNTIFLYIRMIIIMVVTFYTTRVVLNALGETDYGIYNIVGSVVVSMVFIQNSLMSATQRFLSYEIGLGNQGNVAMVFSSSLNLHIKFVALILVVLETIGFWFLNHVLSIPPDRMLAANVVYQFSILTFCLTILRIPYNAIIVSHESMNIFALLSVVEAILRLLIVFSLQLFFADKLIVYGFLIFLLSLTINGMYISYCRRHFEEETRFNIHGDKEIKKKLQGFLGWNLLGGLTSVATSEGPNYFMNYYLGVTVNAAMGIAKQVSSGVYQFSANFQTAFNPQIVKAYASKENDYLFSLIHKTSLLSFYLLFIFAFPVLLCCDFIFDLWLVNVPKYTVVFSSLLIIGQLISALSSPLWMVAHATGDIKQYQIVLSCFSLSILPASYLILEFNYPSYYILAFHVFICVLVYAYRLWFAKKRLNFPVMPYLYEVIFKCILLTVLIVPIPIFLSYHVTGLWQNISLILFSMLLSCIVIFYMGLDKETREALVTYIKKTLYKI